MFWELGGLTEDQARIGLALSQRIWTRYQQHGAPYHTYLALAALAGVIVSGKFKDWHVHDGQLISADNMLRVSQTELYQVQLYRESYYSLLFSRLPRIPVDCP